MAGTLVCGRQVLGGFEPGDRPYFIENGAVLVRGGSIVAVGAEAELAASAPDAERLGGPGFVVLPGLVNAHHHVGLTPFQLGSPDLPLELWFASRIGLRLIDPHLDTLFGGFELISSGVTTVQHLHSRVAGGTPEYMEAAEAVLDAYDAIGMRASFSFALRDQNRLVYAEDQAFVASLPAELQAPTAGYLRQFTLPLEDQFALFEGLRGRFGGSERARIQLAPANLHWLSDTGLEATAEIAAKSGAPLHMHLLETPYQQAYAQKRFGKSAVAVLRDFGLTGPSLTIGHGVWMEEDDIALCAESGTHLCHNCSSNLRLASGRANLNGLLAAGVPVALGIDEAGLNDDHDMLQEMRLVYHLHRGHGHDAPRPSAGQILRMATEHGAATTPFAAEVGRLEPGRAADLLLLDYAAMTTPYQDAELPLADIILQRAKAGALSLVMVAGEVIFRDGRFTRIDRQAVLAEIAARLAWPPTETESERRRLGAALLPHMREFYTGYL